MGVMEVILLLLLAVSVILVVANNFHYYTLKVIANRKYEKLYYYRLEPCDGNVLFESRPGMDDVAVCLICGYEAKKAMGSPLYSSNSPEYLRMMKESYPHQKETLAWQEFKKTYWYRLATK